MQDRKRFKHELTSPDGTLVRRTNSETLRYNLLAQGWQETRVKPKVRRDKNAPDSPAYTPGDGPRAKSGKSGKGGQGKGSQSTEAVGDKESNSGDSQE